MKHVCLNRENAQICFGVNTGTCNLICNLLEQKNVSAYEKVALHALVSHLLTKVNAEMSWKLEIIITKSRPVFFVWNLSSEACLGHLLTTISCVHVMCVMPIVESQFNHNFASKIPQRTSRGSSNVLKVDRVASLLLHVIPRRWRRRRLLTLAENVSGFVWTQPWRTASRLSPTRFRLRTLIFLVWNII